MWPFCGQLRDVRLVEPPASQLRRMGNRAPMQDVRLALNQLAELFDHARPMPLMRDRVRIDKRDTDALAAAIDGEIRDAVERGTLSREAGYNVLSVTTRVRKDLRNAYPVPLTDQVRISRSQAAELGRALRAAACH